MLMAIIVILQVLGFEDCTVPLDEVGYIIYWIRFDETVAFSNKELEHVLIHIECSCC